MYTYNTNILADPAWILVAINAKLNNCSMKITWENRDGRQRNICEQCLPSSYANFATQLATFKWLRLPHPLHIYVSRRMYM